MAVVHVLAAIEDHFGVAIADDEVSADTFATLGPWRILSKRTIASCGLSTCGCIDSLFAEIPYGTADDSSQSRSLPGQVHEASGACS